MCWSNMPRVTAARRLVQESPLPVLLTCRSDAEEERGGEETDRVSFLEAVGTAEVAPQLLVEEAHGRASNIRQKVRLVVTIRSRFVRTLRGWC